MVLIKFNIRNQIIMRGDAFKVVSDSRNYLHAKFDFLTDEWRGKTATAIFRNASDAYEVVLDQEDTCLVPWEVLQKDAGDFEVSVFAGDLITANAVKVQVYESGYSDDLESSTPPTPSVYAQIIERMDGVEDIVIEKTALAEEYAEQAEGSAASAAESAATATQKAVEAARSAETASDAAGTAESAKTAAVEAAGASQTASQTAVNAAGNASASELSAAQSAQSASENARTASNASQVASTKADEASQSASRAAASASEASTSATHAAGAATSASGYASDANASATAAAGSAQTASTKATQASASASSAEASANTASTANANAQAAKTAAETAQGAAEDAQEAAETARDAIQDSAAQIAQNTSDIDFLKEDLSESVSDLKNAFGAIATGDEFEFPLNTTWAQGGVNQEGEYSSWSRIRTDYIELEGIGQLTLIPASGYASCSVIYDSNKQVLRYTLWSTQNVTVSLADNEKYIRFSLRKDPEANLSPSAGVNLTATAVYKLPSDVSGNSNAIKKMQSFAEDGLIWERGGVSSGSNYNSNTRIRTQFLDVSNYGRLTASVQTGYKYAINVFDKSKNYLFMLPASGWVADERTIEADENIGFIKVMLATANDDTLSDTSISSNFALNADWKATGEIKNIANNETNLLDGATWVRGTLDNDGAYISSTSRAVTDDFVDISGCRSLHVHPLINTLWCVLFFYGQHGVIAKSGRIIGDTEIEVPSNTTKLKIIISNVPEAWLNNATIGNALKIYKGTGYDQSNNGNILADDYFCSTCVNKKEIPNLESGITVLAFGDSITAEQTSEGWVYHFASMTGCTVVDKAVGGSSFGHAETDSGHWISTQIANTSDATWEDADLVIVAAGTNDYGHGEPLDEIKEYVQDVIDAIRAKTNVPIVFITPIRRGLSVYDDPMQKLPMISGIISNVALTNQCNVICGFDIPIPTYNINGLIDNMTRDGLHPIATGANAYARFLVGALN